MKKLLFVFVLFLVACSAPKVIVESPGQIPVTTPAVTPPAVTETAPEPEAPAVREVPCGETCVEDCSKNAIAACGSTVAYVDYDECVPRCGTFLREQGCKAACAAENTIECGVIFKSECKKECRDACA